MKKYIFLLFFILPGTIGHAHQLNQRNNLQNGSVSEAGYQGIAEIGYGFNVSDDGFPFLKVNIINGYRVNSWFYVGAGTGLRLYFDNDAMFNSFAAYPVIPFFADFRVYLNRNKVWPYLSMSMGYSFDASDYFSALGLLINPTAGFAFRISDKLGMHTGMGFDYQQMIIDGPDDSVNRNAISLNIGIDF